MRCSQRCSQRALVLETTTPQVVDLRCHVELEGIEPSTSSMLGNITKGDGLDEKWNPPHLPGMRPRDFQACHSDAVT